MHKISIYHNPQCGTSRNTLAMIRNTGIEPEVIEYLKTPPTKAELVNLITNMKLTARDVMRAKGDLYDELDLGNEKWTNEELVDFMMLHPILINRPIVVTELGGRLCRPSELVLEILPLPQKTTFTKEDGQVVN